MIRHYLFALIILTLFGLSVCSLKTKNLNDELSAELDSSVGSVTPIVLYHGMGDTADGSIYFVKEFLQKHLNDVYVYSVRMGNNFEEDFMSGYFMNLNTQVDTACQLIKNDTNLSNGYNAIGFSQGGQILRAIAQRCPEPAMLNLISLGGQHQGVYGLPRCPGENKTICDLVRRLLNYGAYTSFVQSHLVQAEYWHDSLQEELYKQKSVFLADINNENVPRNQLYKQRLTKLKNLVLVMFANDTIVDPKETELFGFYKAGQAKQMYSLRESDLYLDDWLGLRVLDESGRLHLFEVPGDHLQIDMNWFLEQIVYKFLRS